MNVRCAAVVGIASAVFSLGLATAAAGGGYSPQAVKAMGERYEAMARHYLGTRVPTVVEQAYPPRAVAALGARYEAMARFYLGTRATSSATGYSPRALAALNDRWQAAARFHQQAELASARREAAAFDWLDAGAGALAATGAVALLGLGALGLRSRSAGRPASPAAS
ncbi:MAG TPA: hypothetical protein VH950_06875 [Gaiellaceae bacterium]|jgi:hypothetical protein